MAKGDEIGMGKICPTLSDQEVAKMKAMIHDSRMADGGSGDIDVPFVPQQRQAPKRATPIHCLMHDRIESSFKYSEREIQQPWNDGRQPNKHTLLVEVQFGKVMKCMR